MERLKKIDYIDIYLIISLLSAGLFFVICILNGGANFEQVLGFFEHEEGADYYIIEAFVPYLNHIYEVNPLMVCQPPLVYIFFWLIYKITPVELPEPGDYVFVRATNHQLTFYMMFHMVMMALLIYAIGQVFKRNDFKYSVLFPITIIFSYPLFGSSLQRGNVIVFVTICLILAYAWIDDDNRIKREFSLLLVSIATANKITPAVCGLSYIKRKDYKRVVRLIAYGVVVFFGPFVFTGGFKGIMLYATNMMSRSEVQVAMGSIKGMSTIVLSVLLKHLSIVNEPLVDLFSEVLRWLFFVLAVGVAYFTKSKWKETLCLMGILVGFLSVNFSYVLIYILPAFLMFLKEKLSDESEKRFVDIIALVLFSFIFTIPFYFMFLPWGVEGTEFVVVYLLLMIVIVDELCVMIKNKGTNKSC